MNEQSAWYERMIDGQRVAMPDTLGTHALQDGSIVTWAATARKETGLARQK